MRRSLSLVSILMTTLLDLLEPEVLGPRLSWRASNIRQNGATAKVSYALRALPVFPAAFDDARRSARSHPRRAIDALPRARGPAGAPRRQRE